MKEKLVSEEKILKILKENNYSGKLAYENLIKKDWEDA